MQRAWLREFNALGMQLRPQAARLVTSFLRECEDPQRMAEQLVEHTKAYFRSRQGSVESIIDGDVIQAVITCMHEASEAAAAEGGAAAEELQQEAMRQNIDHMDLGDGVQVFDALVDIHPFDFNLATKDWVPSLHKPQIFPGSATKAKIYCDRYHLLWQRLVLEGELVPEASAGEVKMNPGQRILTPVESLVGSKGRKLTFGLISREHDGARQWAIEDVHRSYPLDIRVEDFDHLVTDGCFVLAEGELVDDRFRVDNLDVPAAVPREVTMDKDAMPPGAFGGTLTQAQVDTLQRAEQENAEGMYVVLSEVTLDNDRTLEKLDDLFQGYESSLPPVAYVFMGNFCSSPFVHSSEGVRGYRDGFERLKIKMRSLPNHVQRGTRFIFVPGPNDPGAPTLPRAKLSSFLTAGLAKEIPNVIMASNPCRIRHFSRELVFFRHDVLRLLRRHEVVPLRGPEGPPTPQQVREEVVRLLLDQAHLVPLPLEESNILWNFDHTLRLYPLPHAIFIGGVSQPFECVYQQSTFCSVGPFYRDASFYAYHPNKNELEPCDVPDAAG
eukprot:TRINITY_DN19644_c0_g2_i1.p1 TRINITY_DN19644_c0_g2~~TRINITY_DN19644_c0_g2_i1.p1  ORF type:complete len:554 (+),score=92.68 TRINITY_DN19644_c0_g2_i1:135-1796(+)